MIGRVGSVADRRAGGEGAAGTANRCRIGQVAPGVGTEEMAAT